MNSKTAMTSPSPRISPWLMRLFAAYNHHYLGGHFHSLRILKNGLPKHSHPTVIFLNHASWWDPLVCLFLSRKFFPGRCSFAPIDEQMLKRYQFFKRLGFFGVEPNSTRGAFSFLRNVDAILKSPHHMLWLTPQGKFADVRERPAVLKSGLGVVAGRLTLGAFLPLAIEYPFWSEPKPEALISFGEPIITGPIPTRSPNEWTTILGQALEKTQDELARYSKKREERDWIMLRAGSGFQSHASRPSSSGPEQEFRHATSQSA